MIDLKAIEAVWFEPRGDPRLAGDVLQDAQRDIPVLIEEIHRLRAWLKYMHGFHGHASLLQTDCDAALAGENVPYE